MKSKSIARTANPFKLTTIYSNDIDIGRPEDTQVYNRELKPVRIDAPRLL